MTHKVYTLLGFAQKAGKIVSGEAGCENAIKQNKVFLLIVSDDASDHTKSRMRSLTDFFRLSLSNGDRKHKLGSVLENHHGPP